MKTQLSVALVLVAFLAAMPAFARSGADHDRPRANQGHVPPPPERRTDLHATPEVEHREGNRTNGMPHVESNHWYGHDAPNDPRYRIEKPFERGHFDHLGPEHRYNVVRIDRDHHRFWFGDGFSFEVAEWDWPLYAGWCWDCGDDFVVYDDVDHVGWYLLYNIHTGGYVHVRYLGR